MWTPPSEPISIIFVFVTVQQKIKILYVGETYLTEKDKHTLSFSDNAQNLYFSNHEATYHIYHL